VDYHCNASTLRFQVHSIKKLVTFALSYSF